MDTITPNTLSSKIPICPIIDDIGEVQENSKKLTKSLRKLRRDLDLCKTCKSVDDCPTLRQFNSMVQTAITEVNEEWDAAIAERLST